jgi:quinohemoprotein ethanol dehydrogenase
MSLSGQTHLVYIPVIDTPSVWVDLVRNGGDLKFLDGFFTTNGIFPDDSYDAADSEAAVRPAARAEGSQGRSAR